MNVCKNVQMLWLREEILFFCWIVKVFVFACVPWTVCAMSTEILWHSYCRVNKKGGSDDGDIRNDSNSSDSGSGSGSGNGNDDGGGCNTFYYHLVFSFTFTLLM